MPVNTVFTPSIETELSHISRGRLIRVCQSSELRIHHEVVKWAYLNIRIYMVYEGITISDYLV